MPAASHIPELPLTYRPRAVRRWGYIVAAVFALACLVMAVSLPLLTHKVFDSLGFVLLALAVGWFCHRHASVHVRADAACVTVRNAFSTRRFEWAELIGVSFPEGDPWAHLDVADGDTCAVMAFQRADGERGVDMAREFNALIDTHSLRP
ncbi:PH domain-containing protein [Dermabacter hominis]|uniref:PH domain-containing protein n=1 Tax=Dermabacter hominis TaxID=36740 RepID=UPI0021A7A11B|nr:PH domain-containing protein [Dermabacter hominis]MCT1806760.1 PH domain-containing protein [Dermabacter hominis]